MADAGPGSRGAAERDDFPDLEDRKVASMADAGPGSRETFALPDLEDLPDSAMADGGPESAPATTGVGIGVGDGWPPQPAKSAGNVASDAPNTPRKAKARLMDAYPSN